MPAKVTIDTVARHAQVSRQTVSNVLNTPHVVREETRRRVEEAIRALGYRASQAARQMRTGRSRLLAVRIEPASDGINGSVLDRFLHGLTEAAESAGYRFMLYTAADDVAEIAVHEELLGSHELDAFVLTGTHHGDPRASWLTARGVPFVTFGRPWGGPDTHPWVDVDGATGTAAATRHLLAAGHQRIGFLGWPTGSGVGDDRRSGWSGVLLERGADPAALVALDREMPDGVTEGERAAHALLTGEDPPTALVCASDSLALGALQTARRLGRPVAIVGFDDTPVARAVGLTSVSQPLGAVAAACVRLLVRVLDGDRALPEPSTVDLTPIGTPAGPPGGGADDSLHVLLKPTLVLRESA